LDILKKKGINLIKLKVNSKNNFDFKIIFKKLYLLGIRNLLIEGGDKLTKNLLKKGLIDCFYLFKSPKNLLKGKNNVFFTSLNILNKTYDNNFKVSSKLAKDTISIYKRKNV
jgi:diaminohydroxyphosphoribosylaminopyrimidine deaminase/5-amino-6-(5-phosphoribosylamino)uracil reductase